MKRIKLSRGKTCKVDDSDFAWLNKNKWFANGKYPFVDFYAMRAGLFSDGERKNKKILMSREIMQCPKGFVVDHINGDTLDNRRSNLRICTFGQNVVNNKTRNNQVGYKGVYVGYKGKFRAMICSKGKRIWLGEHPTAKCAARVYNEAAKKYHGEYANLNKL